MIKINCPGCKTDGSFSLTGADYQGPYKCWKCRELFTIEIANNKLKSFEPLSQEEFDKQQEIAALKAKFRNPD